MIPKKKFLKKGGDGFVLDSYRIIDANINRSKEGLRVCEEISRFHLNNKKISQKIRYLRHKITHIIKASKLKTHMLFAGRDSKNDIGKTYCLQAKKKSFKQIFLANIQRVKEALRVLEDFLKLFDAHASQKIQKLRFDVYSLEKETIEQFPALLDP